MNNLASDAIVLARNSTLCRLRNLRNFPKSDLIPTSMWSWPKLCKTYILVQINKCNVETHVKWIYLLSCVLHYIPSSIKFSQNMISVGMPTLIVGTWSRIHYLHIKINLPETPIHRRVIISPEDSSISFHRYLIPLLSLCWSVKTKPLPQLCGDLRKQKIVLPSWTLGWYFARHLSLGFIALWIDRLSCEICLADNVCFYWNMTHSCMWYFTMLVQ